MEDNHMQQLPAEQPPSYTQSHDPQSIHLPSVPTTELPQIHHERILPPLPSIAPEPTYRSDAVDHKYQHTPWPSSNPLTAYYQPSHTSPIIRPARALGSPSAMDMDVATPPESRSRRGGSVLSIDDPDVRIAAEALGDLRADFMKSPPQQHTSLPPSSPARSQYGSQQPEPLLSLLTTSHPLIGTAIGGSISAYSASKNYSPRFKSSAEYVERRFSPMVNTVGSVGRVAGVEGGVRWFLGGRRPSHHQPSDPETANQGSHKRRKVGDDTEMEGDVSTVKDPKLRHDLPLHYRERRPSQGSMAESLPAYDDHRSPGYEEQALVATQQPDSSVSPGSTWQSRLILSTSGLSVAMSEESLRSLRYCLGWLRWANEHIGKVISALKSVLEQYDSSRLPRGAITNGENGGQEGQLVLRDQDADRTALNGKILELKADVLKTLKDVVDVVSKYAGGALPENARILVRKHLTSLPQRFRLASTAPDGTSNPTTADKEGEVREGARRVMVLAKEGLDMMSQVSGVLDGTIVSAEEWCERLGRKKRAEAEGLDGEKEIRMAEDQLHNSFQGRPFSSHREDVKMG